MFRKIAGKWQRERGGEGDFKGKSKSDGKGKDGGKHSAGKGKDDGKVQERHGADRQVAMGAMQARMGIEALRVAALLKGLL